MGVVLLLVSGFLIGCGFGFCFFVYVCVCSFGWLVGWFWDFLCVLLLLFPHSPPKTQQKQTNKNNKLKQNTIAVPLMDFS